MTTTLRKTIPHEVEIPLTGTDIAELFWSLDETAQAEFFNHLGTKDFLCMQLHALMVCDELSNTGRTAMQRIGEYSRKETP
jgi:hypothetical protein